MSSLRSFKLFIVAFDPQVEAFIESIREIKGLKKIRGWKEFDMTLCHYSDVRCIEKLKEVAGEIKAIVLQEKAA